MNARRKSDQHGAVMQFRRRMAAIKEQTAPLVEKLHERIDNLTSSTPPPPSDEDIEAAVASSK